ncbi:SPOR domain-containing protein [Sulfuritalea hydrogenivorans]|uniref:Sporulation related n=1 Tax=Sulfuritalea hydrogenivorans sk43H TaxID=1223802 RepID=W0SH86_9PROT|nr:SPOR domain-containing protein [Sulfuritalea hydrogenivorans]BAO29108.1 sporulation related [Sulfuritalea hydrogenivorans sk43H]
MAEQDTSPDADLQLKKRARRRLVGAVALALFAVIILPMVMDREPRPLSQDIQVRIPSQDSTGLASRVIPGKPAATPMPAPESKPAAEQKPEVPAKPEPAAAVPAAAAPAANTKPAPAAAVMPVAKPAEKPVEKPAAPEKKAETVEKPATKTSTEAKPAVDASGQWVVQLGAYKEAGNVKVLLSKLKGIGVPAYTEKFDSPQGPRTRVRAGPFASQDAAEKARARIKIIGVDGPVAPK